MSDYRICFSETGGPEVLRVEPVSLAAPGEGEVLVRHDAIGLNFIDTYHRSGLYPVELPSGLGTEAAGVIEAVGPGVTAFQPGDRIVYGGGPIGSCATARLFPAARLVHLPDHLPSDTAAAAMLKGMTAEFLIERCANVHAGQTVLVHAAAGGVGSILVQWLTSIGATVLAHAGNDAKAAAVRAMGVANVSSAPFDALPGWVREQTGGRGVDAVFDGVGAASWQASLGAVARRGLIVSYGNASGPVPPFSALDLLRAGSVFVTRPTLFDYCSTTGELRASATRLFEMIGSGAVRINIGQRFPLRDAAQAHRALEGRETTGSTVLLP